MVFASSSDGDVVSSISKGFPYDSSELLNFVNCSKVITVFPDNNYDRASTSISSSQPPFFINSVCSLIVSKRRPHIL